MLSALKGRKGSLRPYRAHWNRWIPKPGALPWAGIRRRFQRRRTLTYAFEPRKDHAENHFTLVLRDQLLAALIIFTLREDWPWSSYILPPRSGRRSSP